MSAIEETRRIAETCINEHAKLVDLTAEVISECQGLRSALQSTWLNDYEFADCIELQAASLAAAADLAQRGFYRDSYNTIRMILEDYLLLCLVWLGTAYTQRYRVARLPEDRTLGAAKQRFIQDAQHKLGKDLLRVIDEGKDVVTLVRRGIRVLDADGNDTGRIVPLYWHAWKQYRSQHFLQRPRLSSRRFLQGEWAIGGRRRRRGTPEKQDRDYYRNFFSFERVLEKLQLNKILTKKTSMRVVVHYNFLSGFSHSTYSSLSSLMDGRSYHQFDGLQYDHYHSELGLLYVAHLGALHMELVDKYLDRSSLPERGGETRRFLRSRVATEAGYFWFLFNDPHYYDKFGYANRRSDYRRRRVVRPEDVRAAVVRYYDDPLRRLKGMHRTTQELTTGNAFVSPFPRDDAWR